MKTMLCSGNKAFTGKARKKPAVQQQQTKSEIEEEEEENEHLLQETLGQIQKKIILKQPKINNKMTTQKIFPINQKW